ncbi:hypothetical protein EQU24_00295 [Methylotuvimicrobium buryatense]|uniref:Uncharacterized protein n=1 Tax=Methylotuvimicrobium buryatense TaxID=95641 RepID=A0A4P9USX7_METBY|nr:hypothetical protein EQU24_00295 [Methylotuvimicrobium buryatense]
MDFGSNSQFGDQKGCGVCLARMSAAGQIFAPRQLLSYMDVMNAENAGAFFCPASPKAPTVGALLHAILGVRAAAKPPWMGLRRSSTGIPHTLKSAKPLKLGIAATLVS